MPTQCCLLGVCCPPEQRAVEVKEFLMEASSEATEKDCEVLASHILDTFDLAPKGFSDFIFKTYFNGDYQTNPPTSG